MISKAKAEMLFKIFKNKVSFMGDDAIVRQFQTQIVGYRGMCMRKEDHADIPHVVRNINYLLNVGQKRGIAHKMLESLYEIQGVVLQEGKVFVKPDGFKKAQHDLSLFGVNSIIVPGNNLGKGKN